MRIFLAGGTGVIGRQLIPLLLESGHQVTATTRTHRKTGLLRDLGAEPTVLDALDADAVGQAVSRAEPDAIIHQMTSLTGTPDMKNFDRWLAVTNQLRTSGTRHLLSAAAAAGVQRFIAQSYTGWPNSRDGAMVKTEDDPLDPDPAAAQQESLNAIRVLEDSVTTAPLAGIVLRYGALYGPGASDGMTEMVRKRMLPIIGGGAGVTSWVHVQDAAAATVAALERGVRGIYNVVDDDPAPVSEWLPLMAATLGAKPPIRVPAWLGRILAGEAAVRWMTEARGSSNAKARRDLGWVPAWSSWRQGFARALVPAAQGQQPGAVP